MGDIENRINRENIKKIGFKICGFKRWSKILEETYDKIIVDFSNGKIHCSIVSGNDSIHVSNCKNIEDILSIERLFGKYAYEN